MRIFLVALMFALLLLISPAAFAFAPLPANLFTDEQSAQKHCPADTIVWLNLPTGIYHFKGQRWYGNTENGSYVCQQEANQAGDRPTHNGQ